MKKIAGVNGAVPISNDGTGMLISTGSTGSTGPAFWSPSDLWGTTNGLLGASLVIQIIILLVMVFKR